MYIMYCISAHGKDASRYQKYDLTPIFLSECFLSVLFAGKKGQKILLGSICLTKQKMGVTGIVKVVLFDHGEKQNSALHTYNF